MSNRRALHYVLKIGNRKRSIAFFKDILGMTVLRHEEFEEGCKATCNGPYDGRWSKTMVGYGGEEDHFVLELTYNYGIASYKKGNDLQHISIRGAHLPQTLQARGLNAAIIQGKCRVTDPDGHLYIVTDDPDVQGCEISGVSINCSELTKSETFWRN